MDTRLLRYYETELSFLKEMGAEFAESYPKIASRLGITGLEVLDPYVERLLEGSAFLAARVQLELDMQFPAFTQHLLEIVYPHYLAPTPSMMIVEMLPAPAQGGLDTGFRVPRGTALRAPLREGETTACVFLTSQDTVLWEASITQLDYIDGRGELVAAGLGAIQGAPRRHPSAACAGRRQEVAGEAARPAWPLCRQPGRAKLATARSALDPGRRPGGTLDGSPRRLGGGAAGGQHRAAWLRIRGVAASDPGPKFRRLSPPAGILRHAGAVLFRRRRWSDARDPARGRVRRRHLHPAFGGRTESRRARCRERHP